MLLGREGSSQRSLTDALEYMGMRGLQKQINELNESNDSPKTTLIKVKGQRSPSEDLEVIKVKTLKSKAKLKLKSK